jgi:starch-binding outer membrane protein, SusD/RagB family
MKKSIFYLIVFFSFIGCEKLMHKEEISIGKIADYDQLNEAVTGVYGKLADMLNSYSNSITISGDDLNVGFNYYSGSQTDTTCSRSSDYQADTYSWDNLYKTILSVNNILGQYDNFKSLDEKTREIIAEIYFIRAYCYFRLTRIYGEIPIIDNTDISYTVPKSKVVDVYKFIEKDLNIAKSYLPKTNSDARIPFVTPHRGATKGFLAEVYLSWAGYPVKDNSKYALALKESGEVIDSADIFGFRLMDDFSWVWDNDHLKSEESIFSLYYTRNSDRYAASCYNGTTYTKDNTYSSNVSIEFPQTETNFYNSYPESYRKEITFFTDVPTYYYDQEGNRIDYIKHYDKIEICDIMKYRKFYIEPQCRKFSYWYGNDYDFSYLGYPKIYIFRFAHTLLTYAEAMAHNGQPDASAYEMLNRIRRRANKVDLYTPSKFDLQPGLSSKAFTDSVIRERAWEFCGEPEGRWFDLVRLEKVEELQWMRNPQEGGPPAYPITKGTYFAPIPSGDIFLNPGLGD